MPVFLISRYATKPEPAKGITTQHHSAGIIEALNVHDAEGKGLEGLRQYKPMTEGWTGHEVAAAQMSAEELRAWVHKA